MEITLVDWTIGVVLLLVLLYKLGTWNHNHFTSKGIKCTKTVPIVGSLASVVLRKKSMATYLEEVCLEFKDDPIVGLLQFITPIIVVQDPELIKRITVKDFDHFTDHQQTVSEESDPIFGKNLFSLKGEKWRTMRATLSPAFTSSKMKNMFHFMNQCGQQLGDYIQSEINKQPDKPYTMNMKDLFTRFTNDVIATSAFGIQVDSLKEKDNEFYRMGKQITNFAGIKSIIILGYLLSPKLMELLRITFFTKKEMDFFCGMIHDAVSTRDREGIVRPDMIHLLMQARKGELKTEEGDEEEDTSKTKKINLTEVDISAQAIIFFAAGFETASTLLAFTAILLATHGDIQKTLQEEVDEILGLDKELTYEKVQKMKYLDMVVSETLRLYPPAIMINRMCSKNFTIPASEKNPEYTIKKGDVVFIPAYGIQRLPKYFPDPQKFDPERFSDENKHNINPWTYLPFGTGPRLCIGQRFALLEAKVALIHILSRFNLVVVDKTPLPLKLDSKAFQLAVDGGFWMGATPRQVIPP